MPPTIQQRFAGVLLGTAVGDALGLPLEGLSRRRNQKIQGKNPPRHRFLGCWGMVSDDTDHHAMVARSLLAHPKDVDAFARSLAWKLRFWLLTLPAGIGFATLRSLIKLWLGFSPHSSGVFSAGNGPAMRVAVIGLWANDAKQLEELVGAATRLSHTDPKATEGALLVARAAAYGLQHDHIEPRSCLESLSEGLQGEDLLNSLRLVGEALEKGQSAESLADDLGLAKGVTGYINHTVPMVLFCWLDEPKDFRQAMTKMLRLGGDADTTAAILGAIMGANLGVEAIPKEWIDGLCDWPRSRSWLEEVASQLAKAKESQQQVRVPALFWPAFLLRSPFYIVVILLHAFRRILPPY